MSALAESQDNHGDPVVTRGLWVWRKWTDIPLIVLALGSLPILLLEFVSDRLSQTDRTFITIVNLTVFVAFVIDYIVELVLAGDRRSYVRREWTSLLIAVSQGLALLQALQILSALRILRALRPLVFLWRLVAVGAAESREVRAAFRDRAVTVAVSVASLVWLTSAAAFTIVEDVGVGRRIESFGDALWWSASTISTVGYGDIYPVTTLGRIVAVLTMIVGVSTFGVVTAKLAAWMLRQR
jgi:voltage-gated potassium channel